MSDILKCAEKYLNEDNDPVKKGILQNQIKDILNEINHNYRIAASLKRFCNNYEQGKIGSIDLNTVDPQIKKMIENNIAFSSVLKDIHDWKKQAHSFVGMFVELNTEIMEMIDTLSREI